MQRDKIDLSSVCKSLIRGGKWKWVGGWHYLNLVSSAIQLACVNSPVFRVANNIGKLVFWRDVSYSPRLTSLWEKKQFIHIILDNNQLNLVRLVRGIGFM